MLPLVTFTGGTRAPTHDASGYWGHHLVRYSIDGLHWEERGQANLRAPGGSGATSVR